MVKAVLLALLAAVSCAQAQIQVGADTNPLPLLSEVFTPPGQTEVERVSGFQALRIWLRIL